MPLAARHRHADPARVRQRRRVTVHARPARRREHHEPGERRAHRHGYSFGCIVARLSVASVPGPRGEIATDRSHLPNGTVVT